nr:immunoglobulin light chain junction region [Macaca mulatta]MOW40800.1 immunoglobulin light chain junction region [Macaca mulatta]MOW41107.1 immunoglobulin light chain junction region [Macaca mulatta]MOW41140.1 immunoglobulin light chain junction region [Macaca mulatta]MOW41354.1 immunoglobulin light chain junction region [Macaca mulatta]
CLQYNTFPLIF